MPERAHATPISARRSTEDDLFRKPDLILAGREQRPGRLAHALLPATFTALAVSIVYLLLYFFLPGGPGQELAAAESPLEIPRRPPPALSVVTESPVPEKNGALPPAAPGGESPALAANALLDSFLAAKDAASRIDMVEPAVTEDELAATFLNGPLPEVARIFSDLPRHDPVEQRTDYPYRLSFLVEGKPNTDYAILIRQRGNQPPKIHLPAFLDLVGGRLAAFTEKPDSREPAVFHVILEAVTGCHDESVPSPDRKFTFKLLSSPFGRETARAYVSTGSRFKKMVEDPASSLRWGIRARATVTLQWNRSENPEQPYLELIEINSLDWDS